MEIAGIKKIRNPRLAEMCMICAHNNMLKKMDARGLDEVTDGLITMLEYSVFFINDCIYDKLIITEDILKKAGEYRFKTKFLHKEMRKRMKVYNDRVSRIDEEFQYALADVNSSLEEDLGPHLEKYYYAVSQAFLDAGISGWKNQLLSHLDVIILLCRRAKSTYDKTGEMYLKSTGMNDNPLDGVYIDGIEKIARELSDMYTKDKVIDMNSSQRVLDAYNVFCQYVFKKDIYEKAYSCARISECS